MLGNGLLHIFHQASGPVSTDIMSNINLNPQGLAFLTANNRLDYVPGIEPLAFHDTFLHAGQSDLGFAMYTVSTLPGSSEALNHYQSSVRKGHQSDNFTNMR